MWFREGGRHHFCVLTRTRGLPASIESPGWTRIFSTVDPEARDSVRTAISSFMASRMTTSWLASSLSPSLTSTFQMLALRGASMGVISGSK